jgi:hypothetical protein
MYQTQYRWAFDYVYGWRMVPVQVFIPVLPQLITPQPIVQPIPGVGAGAGARR